MENRDLSRSIETTEAPHFLSEKLKDKCFKTKRLSQRATAFRIYLLSAREKVSKNILHPSGSKDSFRTGEKGQSGFTQDKRDSFRCPSCLWGNHKIK